MLFCPENFDNHDTKFCRTHNEDFHESLEPMLDKVKAHGDSLQITTSVLSILQLSLRE
jgi:hypothetical protein